MEETAILLDNIRKMFNDFCGDFAFGDGDRLPCGDYGDTNIQKSF